MSDVSDKVMTIFREMAGDAADRLSGSRYLADVNTRITSALAGDNASEDVILRQDGIGFHTVDWQNEAAFVVAVCLYPDRFTDEEIRDGVESLLLHAPAHLLEAARLGGYSTENFFHKKEE